MFKQDTEPILLLPNLPNIPTYLSEARSKLSILPYHLRSLWLFTFSDFKTIVGPCTAFAILQILGSHAFSDESIQTAPAITFTTIAKVIWWTWITLLPLDIANQRLSVEEDQVNKPWRPLPAGRLTKDQATLTMLAVYPVAILSGLFVGALKESLALVALGYWYNDIGASDGHYLGRNFVNACGITSFLSGSLSIMLHQPSLSQSVHMTNTTSATPTRLPSFNAWIIIIWLIIMTAIQSQDIPDQEGDRLRQRKTLPLVHGDMTARYSVAIPVLFWSVFCPWFWSVSPTFYFPNIIFGGWIAWRQVMKRTVKDDKKTYKFWNLWLAFLFSLPLQRGFSV